MTAEFTVQKRIELQTEDIPNTHGLIRTLNQKSIKQISASASGDCYGIYIFALSNGGGNPVPWYVGMAAKQTLRAESLTRDKLRKYSAAMFGRQGKPSITFISADSKKSASKIDSLEALLIWIARSKNPSLINERKVSGRPKSIISIVNQVSVRGVINRSQGQPSKNAQSFAGLMGLK
ncbi:hypothetical protein QY702_22350 [Xanthomonas campestris pv. plantaginis]|uniref:hypothetical protein n=1 Tax=Xanthomonas campestris TaxID=339 RepID=UPI002B23348A|nr:hypothetical protein [Xanthomonas campestris]MEA9609083.1 hypothetical protein [Xanthomonas campestris pv. plantaginis]